MFLNMKKNKNRLFNNSKSTDFTSLKGLTHEHNDVINTDTKRRSLDLTSTISNFINNSTIVSKMRGDICFSTNYKKMTFWDLITLPIMWLITILIWLKMVIQKLYFFILSQILKFTNMLPSYGKKEDKTIEKPPTHKSILTVNICYAFLHLS